MKRATFSLEGYQFEEFRIKTLNKPEGEISIKIDPSGVLNTEDNSYTLNLFFQAFDEKKKENEFVGCKLKSRFVFSNDLTSIEDIPPYFFANSIAIVFPYLRSFISSLTIQANVRPVILPTMNLGSLSEPLKANTEILAVE